MAWLAAIPSACAKSSPSATTPVTEVKAQKSDFTFASITDYRDPKFLPGAVKYGDIAFIREALGERLKIR